MGYEELSRETCYMRRERRVSVAVYSCKIFLLLFYWLAYVASRQYSEPRRQRQKNYTCEYSFMNASGSEIREHFFASRHCGFVSHDACLYSSSKQWVVVIHQKHRLGLGHFKL
jgi:hypothetical protein